MSLPLALLRLAARFASFFLPIALYSLHFCNDDNDYQFAHRNRRLAHGDALNTAHTLHTVV